MTIYIYLSVVTFLIILLLYLSFKITHRSLLSRFVPKRPDIYSESDESKDDIEEYIDDPVAVRKLQKSCQSYMELDEKDKSDFVIFSEEVDDILDEYDIDYNEDRFLDYNEFRKRVKACLMEDYYEDEREV